MRWPSRAVPSVICEAMPGTAPRISKRRWTTIARSFRSLLADHPGRAGRLLNAAVATAQLMSGDPGANARAARSYLEEALDLTDEAAKPRASASRDDAGPTLLT